MRIMINRVAFDSDQCFGANLGNNCRRLVSSTQTVLDTCTCEVEPCRPIVVSAPPPTIGSLLALRLLVTACLRQSRQPTSYGKRSLSSVWLRCGWDETGCVRLTLAPTSPAGSTKYPAVQCQPRAKGAKRQGNVGSARSSGSIGIQVVVGIHRHSGNGMRTLGTQTEDSERQPRPQPLWGRPFAEQSVTSSVLP